MNDEVVIIVTWMDGKVEVYRDASRHHVENGVLTIGQSTGSAGLPLPWRETIHLPLANIRKFAVTNGEHPQVRIADLGRRSHGADPQPPKP